MEVNHFWHFLAQLSPPLRDGPLLAKGVQTRLWTNKRFQGLRILSLILSFSTSIRYFASAPGLFFCLWCKEGLVIVGGGDQQLLRRRKQWMLALRPGQHQSAGRVAILQKDFYNKVTWDDIHRTPGIPRHRPGQFIIRQILCCGRWLFSWIIFTCTLLCSIVVIKSKIGSGTL